MPTAAHDTMQEHRATEHDSILLLHPLAREISTKVTERVIQSSTDLIQNEKLLKAMHSGRRELQAYIEAQMRVWLRDVWMTGTAMSPGCCTPTPPGSSLRSAVRTHHPPTHTSTAGTSRSTPTWCTRRHDIHDRNGACSDKLGLGQGRARWPEDLCRLQPSSPSPQRPSTSENAWACDMKFRGEINPQLC